MSGHWHVTKSRLAPKLCAVDAALLTPLGGGQQNVSRARSLAVSMSSSSAAAQPDKSARAAGSRMLIYCWIVNTKE